MSMAFMLLLIEGVITFYLMIQFMELIMRFPNDYVRYRLYRMCTGVIFSFILNLSISSLMAWFTSGGMIAGFANLGSSILVAATLPIYVKWKYPMTEIIARVEEKKKLKAFYKEEERRKRQRMKEFMKKEAV